MNQKMNQLCFRQCNRKKINPITNMMCFSTQLQSKKSISMKNEKYRLKYSTPSLDSFKLNKVKNMPSSSSHSKHPSIFSTNNSCIESIFQNNSKNILLLKHSQHSQRSSANNNLTTIQQLRSYQEIKKKLRSQLSSKNLLSQQQEEKNAIQQINPKENIWFHPYRQFPLIFQTFYFSLIQGKEISKTKFFQFLQAIQQQLKFAKIIQQPNILLLKDQIGNLLEQKQQKPTLVLDLDETLIHSIFNQGYGKTSEHSVIINSYQQFFHIRPYALEFLEEMSKIFEIIIFSASTKEYVTTICNYIDPKRKYISHILSRNNCYIAPAGYVIKDLRVLDHRNLQKVVIVDNLALCFAFQIENGIPILSWLGDENDEELKYLMKYLTELSQEQNIAAKNYDNLKLYQLANDQKIQISHGW